ncbi:MAG: 4Fe-4S dicluster domain-containing protein, partial [Methanobrevibacter sp.]|nr:4Fe-4S dicluster domain-containing protein [Methanobrevibacter sp.]
IVMEPLKGGFLVDVPKEAEDIMRSYNPDEAPISWAFRYVAGIEGVFMVLAGASTLEQMEEDIAFMDNYKPLNEEEHKIIEEVTEIINSKIAIPCTKCNYCISSCPANIMIPKLFDLYNNEKIQGLEIGAFSAVGNAYRNYSCLEGVGIASDCTACEACMKECPQQIDIPSLMPEVAKTFETETYGFTKDD